MRKYVPQKLRNYVQQSPKVKMPQRDVKTYNKELTKYYREILLLYCDLAIDTSEKLLDSEISPLERLQVQKSQNELYAISEVVKKMFFNTSSSTSDTSGEVHEDRVAFVTEITALATLVKPKFFKKVQKWFVETVRNINGLVNTND